MFLKLTMFLAHTPDKPKPVYVNVNHITHLYQNTGKFYRRVETETEVISEQFEATYTIICFDAGMHEESDSVRVIETPEDIGFMLPETVWSV